MIRVEWNWSCVWETDFNKPGPERREAWGDWWELIIGPLRIYWQKDPVTPFEPRDKE